MLLILSSIVFLILFLQTFFLGGAVLPGILGMLLCAAGIVWLLLLKKQGKHRLGAVSVSAGLILSVICCVFITPGARVGTLRHKEALLKRISSAESIETAEEKYNSCVKVYGEDDASALCLANYYIRADEADKGGSMLLELNNKTSIEYYLTRVACCNKSGGRSCVTGTLFDAVAEHPSWAKGHLMLGLSCYERGDYTSAIYYLKKARLLDQSDGYSLCYLGVISYDRGSYRAAENYLTDAGKLAGNDSYLLGIIDVYRECVAREVK